MNVVTLIFRQKFQRYLILTPLLFLMGLIFNCANVKGSTLSKYPKNQVADSICLLYKSQIRELPLKEGIDVLDQYIDESSNEKDRDNLRSYWVETKANFFMDKGYEDAAKEFVLSQIEQLKLIDKTKQECDLLLWLSIHYVHVSNYPKAFEKLVELDKELKKLGYENFPRVNEFIEAYSNVLYYFGDYEKAKNYLDTAVYYPFNSYQNEINIYNNAALICLHEDDDCSANYIQKALDIASSPDILDSTWIGILSGNLGMYYYGKNDLDKAEELFQKDFTYCKHTGEYTSSSFAGIQLAKLKFKQNKFDEGLTYLNQVKEMPPVTKGGNADMMLNYYSALKDYYRADGQYEKALELDDSTDLYWKKVIELKDNSITKKLEEKISTERHLAQIKLLDQQYHQDVLIRNILIAIAFVLICLIAVIYWQNRMKRNREKQVLILKQENTEEKLNNAQHQLLKYINNISEKNRLIEKFNEELESLRTIKSDVDESKKAEIKNQLYEQSLLTDQDWFEFKRLFDNVHPGYYERLENKYPQLTFAETRLFLLHKLGLSAPEMAGMLGISPNSVRKTLLRLRKKLEIEDNTEFIRLVHEI